MNKLLTELNEIKKQFGLTAQNGNLLLSFEEILASEKIEPAFEAMHKNGFLNKIFPEFVNAIGIDQKNEHHTYPVNIHSLKSVAAVNTLLDIGENQKHILYWTTLLHDIGKPPALKLAQKKGRYYFTGHAHIGARMVPKILKRFNFPSDEIKQIKLLVEYHEIFRYMKLYNMGNWGNRLTPENIFIIIDKIGIDNFDYLLKIHKCDYTAQSEFWRDKKELLNKRTEDIFLYYKKINGIEDLKYF